MKSMTADEIYKVMKDIEWDRRHIEYYDKFGKHHIGWSDFVENRADSDTGECCIGFLEDDTGDAYCVYECDIDSIKVLD